MANVAASIEFWQDVTCAGEDHAEWFVTVADDDGEEIKQFGPYETMSAAKEKAWDLAILEYGIDDVGHRMTDGRLAV